MTTLEYVESLKGAMINADVILPGRLNPASLPRWKAIVQDVSHSRGVPVAQLMGRSQVWAISHARFECWALIREKMGVSYPTIARWWGVDHSSVMHGVRRWNTQLKGMYE